MEQFNSNSYKKQTPMQEFYHSCLGKIIILAAIAIILIVVAAITRPTESAMRYEMEDNIRECLHDNDSIKSDEIDEYIGNLGRILTRADTTQTNAEQWKIYQKHNRLEIYTHMFYRTAHIVNNLHPDGVRVGIGIFDLVIPTLNYSDLLMNTGAVRGDYGGKLIMDTNIPDEYTGENPNVQPFHYKGDPDN